MASKLDEQDLKGISVAGFTYQGQESLELPKAAAQPSEFVKVATHLSFIYLASTINTCWR